MNTEYIDLFKVYIYTFNVCQLRLILVYRGQLGIN